MQIRSLILKLDRVLSISEQNPLMRKQVHSMVQEKGIHQKTLKLANKNTEKQSFQMVP
jgi:hypothetical protein